MNTVEIILDEPHEGQQYILDHAKRFNVVKCGRRWGKTTICDLLITEPALTDRRPVAYFAPTYKDLEEFWTEFISKCYFIIKTKSEKHKHLVLINGAKIEFWSLEDPNSSRGRKYQRVIIDECEKVRKLKYAWEKTIRATLTDYIGDAWFFSTPNRLHNPNSYFLNVLCTNYTKFDNWTMYTAPSHENPYLPREDLEDAEQTLDDLSYKQEYLAEDVKQVERPFIWAFDENVHVTQDIDFDDRLPIDLCFDFNIDPATCLVRQHGPDFCYTLDEIRVENTDPFEICDRIDTKFGDKLFLVYGDATGHARNFAVKGNKSVYQIIQAELRLSHKQMRVPKSNPYVKESRTLTNSLFARFPNYKVHSRCRYYIDDLKFVEVNDKGDIEKNKDTHKSHLLDCGRYHDWYEFKWWLDKVK